MAQKIHPIGFRIGISKDWRSRWFASKDDYADMVLEDHKIRKLLHEKLSTAGLKKIEIERSVNELEVYVYVSKPGLVIGKGGSGVEDLEKELKKHTKSKVKLTVYEVKTPEIEAKLVGDYISRQLKRRIPFRSVSNSAVQTAIDKGAKGIKIKLSGRLGGVKVARAEVFKKGSVPAQTLRADIDYAQIHCQTLDGLIGIKVWIYKGELDL